MLILSALPLIHSPTGGHRRPSVYVGPWNRVESEWHRGQNWRLERGPEGARMTSERAVRYRWNRVGKGNTPQLGADFRSRPLYPPHDWTGPPRRGARAAESDSLLTSGRRSVPFCRIHWEHTRLRTRGLDNVCAPRARTPPGRWHLEPSVPLDPLGDYSALAPPVERRVVTSLRPDVTTAAEGLRVIQVCPTTAPKVITAPIAMNQVTRVNTTPIAPYR